MKKFSDGFSVLMAVYAKDEPSLFSNAIKSIMNNTLKPNQIIVVVDGPISEDLEFVLKDQENQSTVLFDIVRLQTNLGLAQALNCGLSHVKHEWIVRADSDDFNIEIRFERLAAYLENNPNCDLVSSYILEVDSKGNALHERQVPLAHSEIIKYLRRRNPFNHMAVAYRTQCVKDVGGYPNIYLKEDYALWALLLKKSISGNLPEVLVRVTAGKQMYKRRGGWKYIYSEFVLQRFLCETECKKYSEAFRDFFLRSAVFIMPSALRGFVYASFLRTGVKPDVS